MTNIFGSLTQYFNSACPEVGVGEGREPRGRGWGRPSGVEMDPEGVSPRAGEKQETMQKAKYKQNLACFQEQTLEIAKIFQNWGMVKQIMTR